MADYNNNYYANNTTVNQRIDNELQPSTASTDPEPLPDWSRCLSIWGIAWPVYFYACGSLFLLLTVYTVLTMVFMSKRLSQRRNLIAADLNIIIVGASRGLLLLIDPHSSRGTIPFVWQRTASAVVLPAMCGSFSLVFRVIFRTADGSASQAMHEHLNRNEFLLSYVVLVFHAFVVAVFFSVYDGVSPKHLLLIVYAIYALWMALACTKFLFRGARLLEHAAHMQKMLKELIGLKRSPADAGQHRTGDSLPTIKVTGASADGLDAEAEAVSGGSISPETPPGCAPIDYDYGYCYWDRSSRKLDAIFERSENEADEDVLTVVYERLSENDASSVATGVSAATFRSMADSTSPLQEQSENGAGHVTADACSSNVGSHALCTEYLVKNPASNSVHNYKITLCTSTTL